MRISNLGLVLALLVSTASAAQSDARSAYELAAQGFEHGLNYGDVLYGRTDPARWPGRGDAHLAELLARKDPIEELTALLKHSAPRVRTLALVALYDREDPKLLPLIAELARDDAPSIGEPKPVARAVIDGRVIPPLDAPPDLEERTVGWCARLFVRYYMQLAGYAPGFDGATDQPGFAEYWHTREAREFCASWFLLRIERAHGAGSPIDDRDLERLHAVRASVDRLPPLDRALTLLWLTHTRNAYAIELGDKFATEDECLEAARSLGRENLLAILRRKTPGDDPDLRAHAGSYSGWYTCAGVAEFALRHAAQLLAPEDARELLELGAREHEYSVDPDGGRMDTVWWWIATAELQPKYARSVLEAAQKSFRRDVFEDALARAELMDTYWRLCESEGDAWPIDLFYAEPLEHDLSPPARTNWVKHLAANGSPRARATLEHLIRDPRFAQIDLETLRVFVEIANAWVEPDLVDRQHLYWLHPPMGENAFSSPGRIAIAMEQYPAATKQVLDELDRWRALLLASIERWNPPSTK